jgi:glycosyltransferase involved in cell wall biosynthesis
MRPSFKVPVDRAVYEPWHHVVTEEEDFYACANQFDIGIAPLLGSAFSRSKSPVKVMEYGAQGVPSVASDVEPYSKYIIHGETGFLAKTDDDWLKYLSLLASDDDLRVKMGAAAREQAKLWSIESKWELWAKAYESLFNGGFR